MMRRFGGRDEAGAQAGGGVLGGDLLEVRAGAGEAAGVGGERVQVRAHAAVVVDEVDGPAGVVRDPFVELGEALGGGRGGVLLVLPAGGDALEAGDVEANATADSMARTLGRRRHSSS